MPRAEQKAHVGAGARGFELQQTLRAIRASGLHGSKEAAAEP